MSINKETCWYDENAYQKIIDGATGVLWGKGSEYINTPHAKVLLNLLNYIDEESHLKLIDLGCTHAELHKISKFNYTGADLPNIIENVSKKLNPNCSYRYFDSNEENFKFLNEYDIVVMSAFIDVLENPIKILTNILQESKKYVILHRQEFSDQPTKITKSTSYTKFSFHTIINFQEFSDIIKEYDILREETLMFYGNNWKSFLLRRK